MPYSTARSAPDVHPIQDPARLGWEPIVMIEHYHIGAEVILGQKNAVEKKMGEKKMEEKTGEDQI